MARHTASWCSHFALRFLLSAPLPCRKFRRAWQAFFLNRRAFADHDDSIGRHQTLDCGIQLAKEGFVKKVRVSLRSLKPVAFPTAQRALRSSLMAIGTLLDPCCNYDLQLIFRLHQAFLLYSVKHSGCRMMI